MNDFTESDLEELIDLVATAEWGIPVRAMEAVLAHGSAAIEPLRAVLREGEAEDEQETEPRFWPVVLLGELRDPNVAPDLAEAIRGTGADDVALSFAAAEALAKIGAPALPALQELLATGEEHHRLWAYYAVGRIQGDAAHALLVAALDADPEMADVVALALGDQGRSEAFEPILRALERVEPWQRPELEDALAQLHGASPEPRLPPKDWRLRYRWQPGTGFFPLMWVTISAIVRGDMQLKRRRSVPSVRPLAEILAGAREEEPDRCDCCGVSTWYATGVPVCPETAADVAFIQERMLGDIADEESLEDLFDVLDEVEGRLAATEGEPRRNGAAARRRREGQRTGLQVLREGCVWLVEQGVETVDAGRARLRREAARAAERYGTPLPAPRLAPAAARAERVGRNEPCPCGSGRKYKKCCGSGAG